MNIVLCGMMGSGKSTIGQIIAQKTLFTLCDTDKIIEKKYGSISQIFAVHGEAYFRELESQTVKELSSCDNLVVATGGGLVLRDKNIALLKEKGKIVFLRAKAETLINRLQKDASRPLLQQGESPSERIKTLLATRAPIYERVADFVVDVDDKGAEEIAESVVLLMK